jgi:hypothetical protein
MRAILHAKFGGKLPELSPASARASRTSPVSRPRDSSVEGFEAALTKARADWRASRGGTRTATCSARVVRRP